MSNDAQRRRAEHFLALHKSPPLLILPNAWDVCSARIFELAGAAAIGTTSAGVSATLGYPDGERMSLEENLSVVRRIADGVDLPVSADIETGYASSPDGVAASARVTWQAGAVGINVEDGTGDAAAPLYDQSLQVEKIRAIRELVSAEEMPLVINARTDVYLVPDDDPSARFRHAVRRANAYQQAGADCVFVPDFGDLDEGMIARLVEEIEAPVNVIAGANTPPIAELEEIGVARVSVGPRPMRAALALLRRIARELLDEGTYRTMLQDTLSYAEVNQMFEAKRHRSP
jgi:2-methylisocitrate lyase-like PEP mutase family enzyme